MAQVHRLLLRLIDCIAIVALMFLLSSCGDNVKERPEVREFRQALFKMRADLDVGINKLQQSENIRLLKLKHDEAMRVVPEAERQKDPVKSYLGAYEHYELAYAITGQLDQSLESMSLKELGEWEEKSTELHKQQQEHWTKAAELNASMDTKK